MYLLFYLQLITSLISLFEVSDRLLCCVELSSTKTHNSIKMSNPAHHSDITVTLPL